MKNRIMRWSSKKWDTQKCIPYARVPISRSSQNNIIDCKKITQPTPNTINKLIQTTLNSTHPPTFKNCNHLVYMYYQIYKNLHEKEWQTNSQSWTNKKKEKN